jgi:hypothetical protein
LEACGFAKRFGDVAGVKAVASYRTPKKAATRRPSRLRTSPSMLRVNQRYPVNDEIFLVFGRNAG